MNTGADESYDLPEVFLLALSFAGIYTVETLQGNDVWYTDVLQKVAEDEDLVLEPLCEETRCEFTALVNHYQALRKIDQMWDFELAALGYGEPSTWGIV